MHCQKRHQKGARLNTKPTYLMDGSETTLGAESLRKCSGKQNRMAIYKSVRVDGILVSTSAKKKSLKRTRPNGEMRIYHMV